MRFGQQRSLWMECVFVVGGRAEHGFSVGDDLIRVLVLTADTHRHQSQADCTDYKVNTALVDGDKAASELQ